MLWCLVWFGFIGWCSVWFFLLYFFSPTQSHSPNVPYTFFPLSLTPLFYFSPTSSLMWFVFLCRFYGWLGVVVWFFLFCGFIGSVGFDGLFVFFFSTSLPTLLLFLLPHSPSAPYTFFYPSLKLPNQTQSFGAGISESDEK